MHINIHFSDAASDYIKKTIEKKNGKGLRITIKKTGCSGYSYAPLVIDEVNLNDVMLTIQNGVTIYVDSKWLDMLNGVHVDYIEDNKSGLKQKKLTFINPNESSRCGCGESFHIE